MRFTLFILLVFSPLVKAAEPLSQLTHEMDLFVKDFQNRKGWNDYIKNHPSLFNDNKLHDAPVVNTGDISVTVDGKGYLIGVGTRSVFINADVKNVVSVLDTPKFFKSLYGLDKPADIFPIQHDGSFDAHIFKLLPGIETQDFTLHYISHWENDSWIGSAKMVKDEREFALRDNVKIVEPAGKGSIYREVALFHPLRWWMRLFHGTVQSVTRSEMYKISLAVKCAAEKLQAGLEMTDNIAQACYKEASR